jgi:hypothetical protein
MDKQLEKDKKLLLTLSGWLYMEDLCSSSYIRDNFHGTLGIADIMIHIVDKVVASDFYQQYHTREDNWESFVEDVGMCWDDYWLEQIKREINKTFHP